MNFKDHIRTPFTEHLCDSYCLFSQNQKPAAELKSNQLNQMNWGKIKRGSNIRRENTLCVSHMKEREPYGAKVFERFIRNRLSIRSSPGNIIRSDGETQEGWKQEVFRGTGTEGAHVHPLLTHIHQRYRHTSLRLNTSTLTVHGSVTR